MTNDVHEKILNLVEPYGTLIYLTNFGSKLYGTDNEKSDTDLKGIYIPNQEIMNLGKHFYDRNIDSLILNSNKYGKNGVDDFDVEIYSLQYFILLCTKGNVNALDLLFSFTNKSAVQFTTDIMKELVLPNMRLFINTTNVHSFVGYCVSQSMKNGIRSNKYNSLTTFIKYIENIDILKQSQITINEMISNMSKEDYSELIETVDFVSIGETKNIKYLSICGKKHQLTIKVSELVGRLKVQEKEYGNRTKDTLDTGNIDWKAVSHSVRVIYECKELFLDNVITFPLKERELIKNIKYGKVSFDEVSNIINNGILEIKELRDNMNDFGEIGKKIDMAIVRKLLIFILNESVTI
jgi:hypothetical protein